jgi:hypothetical protein
MNESHAGAVPGNPLLPPAAVEFLQELLAEIAAVSSLTAMSVCMLRGMRRFGLLLLAHVLEQRDLPFRRRELAVVCPDCHTAMRRGRNLRRVCRYLLLGKLSYRRCGYECPRCHRRLFPLDRQLDLATNLRGHSSEFASSLVLLCTVVPFGKGCELFSTLCGVAVSTRLARTLTFTIGTRLFEAEMQRAQVLWDQRLTRPEVFEPTPAQLRTLERHERVYVMTDNSKVGLQEGKRGRHAPKLKTLRKLMQHERLKRARAAKRVKLGVVSNEVAESPTDDGLADDSWRDVRGLLIFRETDLAQSSSCRREIVKRRVLGHVGTKEEWLRLVHMAFHEEGVYTAHEVVVIADGGNGIWESIDELLPSTTSRRVVQILDWYHAASHLWAVGRALKGFKTAAQRKRCVAWVGTLLDYLAEGRVANVIQRLEKLRESRAEAAEAIRKCIKYFDGHRDRMRYSRYRKQGMLIGSGAMESIHAWVFQARCRLPGMRWSEAGVNAMLRLRCSWASGRWDEDFSSAATTTQETCCQIKAAA